MLINSIKKSALLAIIAATFLCVGALITNSVLAATTNTFEFSVVNSSDDARNVRNSTRGDFKAVVHYMGNFNNTNFVHGLRFADISLPAGTKITSASLQFYSAGLIQEPLPNITFAGELSPNASTFQLVSSTPQKRQTTANTVDYQPASNAWSEQGFIQTPIDITSIVTEVLNQPDWQDGNALVVTQAADAAANTYVSYSTYDRDPARAPRLIITVEKSPLAALQDTFEKIQDMVNLQKLERQITKSSSSANTMAWIYPGEPACRTVDELGDGRAIDVLKPEYFTVTLAGKLILLDEATAGCNGFSEKNLSSIKNHTDQVYTTVSAGGEAVAAFFNTTQQEQSTSIATLVNFAVTNNLSGIEIDFEGFGGWTPATYSGYKAFLTDLGNALHKADKKLMVDVPPISNDLEQSYYLLTYEDIASLPVDYIVVMAYDYQYDHGAGSAIAPNFWVTDIVKNAQTYIDADRLVIGIPSYGYYGPRNSYLMTVTSSDEVVKNIDLKEVTTDPYSYEQVYQNQHNVYIFNNAESVDKKRALIESLGVQYVSVWALGGNPWFTD